MLSRHFRRRIMPCVVLACAVLATPTAAASRSMRVMLDGQPSTIAEAGGFYCHDLARSELHCFRTETARDRSVDKVLAGRTAGGSLAPMGATSSGYVVAYAAISYGGNSVVLSQNYANLGSIGWDNIISSYKVFTSVTGKFFDNASYGGRYQPFCCYTNVSYVGDTLNDTFSSFRLP